MRFKIDWANLIVGSKFTVFCFVLLCIEGNFPSTSPPGGGAYIWRGDLTESFWRYRFGGLIFPILRYLNIIFLTEHFFAAKMLALLRVGRIQKGKQWGGRGRNEN